MREYLSSIRLVQNNQIRISEKASIFSICPHANVGTRKKDKNNSYSAENVDDRLQKICLLDVEQVGISRVLKCVESKFI